MSRLDHELKEIKDNLEETEKKLSDLSKYRWIFAGVIILFSFLISEGNVIEKLFSVNTIQQPTQGVLK